VTAVRVIAACGALLLVAGGIAAYVALRSHEGMPHPEVQVRASWPGHGPEEVERQVTAVLERRIFRLPGVVRVRSRSAAGSAVVTARAEREMEMPLLQREVREAVRAAAPELPSDVLPPTIAAVADPRGSFLYTLESDRMTAVDLLTLHERVLRPRLEPLEGVARVETCGGAERQIEVVLDPARLRAYGLAVSEVSAAILRDRAALRSPADLAHILLGQQGPANIQLRDIAQIVNGARMLPCHCARSHGAGAICGRVSIQRGADPEVVRLRIRAAIGEAMPALPQDARLQSIGEHSEILRALVTFAALPAPEEILRAAGEIRRALGQIPEVADVITESRPDRGEVTALIESAKRERWRAEIQNVGALRRALSIRLRQLPGITARFIGAGEVDVHLLGSEVDVLAGLARRVRDIAARLPDVEEAVIVGGGLAPEISLRLDPARAAAQGVLLSEAQAHFEALQGGRAIGRLNVGAERVPIRLRVAQGGADVGRALLRGRGGGVPLGQIASLERRQRLTEISRLNGRLTIRVHVRGGAPAELLDALRPHLADVRLPVGYALELDPSAPHAR
jgi:multidrug efflux pump subunit AcrB